MYKTKKRFKILSLFVCFIMVVSGMSGSAIAAGTTPLVGVHPESEMNGGASTYGLSKPTAIWNLGVSGYYTFSGWNSSDPLYSNYKFTGVSKVRISVTNNHSSSVTVKLLKEQPGIDFSVSTETIKAGQNKLWTANMDSSRYYILRFSSPSNFEGFIIGI